MSARKSQAIALPIGDEEFLFAMEINALIALPLVFKATIELGIQEIMAKSGPMVRFCLLRLPPVSPQAPDTWDRSLQLLSSCSILSCILAQDTEGNPLRLYGLGPKTKHFIRAHGTATFAAPLLLMHTDKIITTGWYCLKEDIMEGGDTFKLAIGLHWIIHVADDKLCVKPLKICWEVVIVDVVLPEHPETAIITRNAFLVGMAVLNITPGGKDRTEREFKVLARASGFNAPKLVRRAYIMWVVKIHKRM